MGAIDTFEYDDFMTDLFLSVLKLYLEKVFFSL